MHSLNTPVSRALSWGEERAASKTRQRVVRLVHVARCCPTLLRQESPETERGETYIRKHKSITRKSIRPSTSCQRKKIQAPKATRRALRKAQLVIPWVLSAPSSRIATSQHEGSAAGCNMTSCRFKLVAIKTTWNPGLVTLTPSKRTHWTWRCHYWHSEGEMLE